MVMVMVMMMMTVGSLVMMLLLILVLSRRNKTALMTWKKFRIVNESIQVNKRVPAKHHLLSKAPGYLIRLSNQHRNTY
jgi:hypothetical protein